VLLCTETPWRKKPKILATLDLRVPDKAHTALNRKVMQAAHDFTELHDGAVHCVYAVPVAGLLSELNVPDPRAFQSEAVKRAKREMAELAEPYGVPAARQHVVMGKVGQTVNRLSKKLKAGLMVMGTSARKGVAAAVIGNSAEKVLMRAATDVLALKP